MNNNIFDILLTLEKKYKVHSTKTQCISLYLPTEDMHARDVLKRIISMVQQALQNNKVLRPFSQLHDQLIFQIQSHIQQTKYLDNGLALFVVVPAKKVSPKTKHSVVSKEMVIVETYPIKPVQKITIDTLFDLGQLIWMERLSKHTLVLQITQQHANLFVLKKQDFEKVLSIQNEFFETTADEYRDKRTTTGSKEVHYSTGNDTVQRKREWQNQLFLQDIRDTFEEKNIHHGKYEYLVVFYSSEFLEFADDFEQEMNHLFHTNEIQTIFDNKNITANNQVQRSTILSTLARLTYEKKQKLLHKAKEQNNLFIQGWNKVTQAVSKHRVETLFIKSNVKHTGYIRGRNMPYTYPVEGSRKVRDIAPWVIKAALDGDAGVFILQNNGTFNNEPEISALLRY